MSYRQVKSSLWTGDVARALHGDMDAWGVANYILHGPESSTSSIGVFRCSLATISDAIGLPIDRLSIAARKVLDSGFAAYDEAYRMWIVFEVGRHRYGERPGLNRTEVQGLVSALPGMMETAPKSFVWRLLHERYAVGWAEIFAAAGIPDQEPIDRLSIADRPVPETGKREEGRREEGKKDPERDVGNPQTGLPTNGSVQEQIPGTDPPPPKRPPWATKSEIDWRVSQTWEALIARRAKYYGRKGFNLPPGRPPTLTPEIREDIVRSLRTHDADLMTPESREEWVRDSKTRAAGEGMYLNRWNLGIRDGSEGENGHRATRYLEPWRPWKIRKGRDPVDEFAQVYFEKRAAAEAAGAVE